LWTIDDGVDGDVEHDTGVDCSCGIGDDSGSRMAEVAAVASVQRCELPYRCCYRSRVFGLSTHFSSGDLLERT
jgi:hypothetical protein